MNFKLKGFFRFGPSHIIVFSFFIVMIIGAMLLSLPIASKNGESISFIDAMFTATSAVCVTGLVVVNTFNYWTLFGKIVILILIQIGGLGFMSLFTIILVVLGKKITLRGRILIQESFNLSTFKGMVMFLKKIIKVTFLIEGIGALILSIKFIPEYGFIKGIFKGIFHSISAFCNAGFDILGDNSLVPYKTDYVINITIMLLIILGGLGFTVLLDIGKWIKYKIAKLKKKSVELFVMSVHSKITITMTVILIILGAILTFVIEYNNPKTLLNIRIDEKILASTFQSVTLRTAGFDAIGQVDLNYGSKFLAIILMAIGGSPGGTAGGIKTVTIGVMVLAVISVIKGKDCITAFKKTISISTMQKALSIIMMMMTLIFIATIILTITEKGIGTKFEFIDILYEVVSALGTVGLSTGVTSSLSFIGKIVIILCMFIGRLGPITIILALSFRKPNKKNVIHYPEEKIIVG
ncbi:TrkH family potassium uptake protein [[Clostridium] colinum]|uniref:TrkH family potassium uptake protein n=1 Tax=[Clostridium] colinum TaxID=36835 RepID=UPI002024769B|nr:TrkH family potassium uptake protein [[Clostridium] colinum]